MDMPAEKRTGFVKSESGNRLSAMMAEDYLELHRRAGEGAFVVWIAIVVPSEIFLGFDSVVCAVPESHAAMSAGKGVGPLQCEKAEAAGYSPDLCSYARIDIGTAFSGGKDSPTMGLPRPHLLVSNTNNCALLAKWFDVYHREWGVPHFILDVPFCYGSQSGDSLDYLLDQFAELIGTVERLSGQTYRPERVAEAVSHSADAYRQWKRFVCLAERRPSAVTAFDTFVQMAPILTARGKPGLAEHYRLLADETEARAAAGIVPVPGERFRLLWDNIAPWHQLRTMSSRLASLGANIVAASYTYCVGSLEGRVDLFDYDGGDPLRYLARMQNFSVCPHGLALRSKAMTDAIGVFSIDGIVFASNRSCKVYSLMQMDQLDIVSQRTGVPAVMIDVDHADARKYSEEAAFARMEALLERIEARRA